KETLLRTKELLAEIGGVLNIFYRSPESWYKSLIKTKHLELSEKDLLGKIAERQTARDRKDWPAADKIRKELEGKGIILEDKKESTTWKIMVGASERNLFAS
ncbi:MAG: hypothetical protein L0922_02220, partial [Candidatus Mariimomonas ferrooxydans]